MEHQSEIFTQMSVDMGEESLLQAKIRIAVNI